jgi:hypothetical protein
MRWDHDGHPQGIDKNGRLYCLKDGVKLSKAGQRVTAEDTHDFSDGIHHIAPHATLFSHRKASGWEDAFNCGLEEL